MLIAKLVKNGAFWLTGLVAVPVVAVLLIFVFVPQHPTDMGRNLVGTLSTGKRFELKIPNCETEPTELWLASRQTSGELREAHGVELSTFHNCIRLPVRIYVSKDETMLFVRRNADFELRTDLHEDAKPIWSDLVDVSSDIPRVIASMGGCCSSDTRTIEADVDRQIELVARSKGLVLLPY